MSIKKFSVTQIDFGRVTKDNVFEFLEIFGFHRYPIDYHLKPQKVTDPRYMDEHFNPLGKVEVGGDDYPMIIVPDYLYNRTLFIIDQEVYDRIKAALKGNSI